MNKFLLILAVLLLLLVPLVWAPPILDTDEYEDSGCTTPKDPFYEGDWVYAQATSLVGAKTYYFKYYDDGSNLRCTSSGYSGGPGTVCDSGGCYLDSSYQEGTWTVQLLDGTKEKDTNTFTVNTVPEFSSALGFGAVSMFSGFIYILIRRKVVGDLGKD